MELLWNGTEESLMDLELDGKLSGERVPFPDTLARDRVCTG